MGMGIKPSFSVSFLRACTSGVFNLFALRVLVQQVAPPVLPLDLTRERMPGSI